MFLIILALLCCLVMLVLCGITPDSANLFIAIIFGIVAFSIIFILPKMFNKENFKTPKLSKVTQLIFSLVIIASMFLGMCFSKVTVGHTGLLVTFGRLENKSYSSGLILKPFWSEMVSMDIRTRKATNKLQAFSKDLQEVTVDFAVNFKIKESEAINIYRQLGANYFDKVCEPAINKVVKDVFSGFTAEELVQSRQKLTSSIIEKLTPEFERYGIILETVAIQDIDFTDVFTNAVEAKQVAEQNKLKAQQEAEQKKIEADADKYIKEKTAEGEANAMLKKAEAEANATLIIAEAQAKSNKLKHESLTEAILKDKLYEAWDGKLPTVTGESNPIISLK